MNYLAGMKWIAFSLMIFTICSCGNEPLKPENDSIPANPAVQSVTDVQSHRPNIDFTPWEGDLYDAIYWRDVKGENIMILSGKLQYFWEEENPAAAKFFPDGEDKSTLSELTEFFAVHYVLKKGDAQWKEYYRYHDYLFGCCDVWLNYQPKTLEVTDTDSDGNAEVIFLYHETEGTGMLEQNYMGHLIMEKDSAFYSVEDVTGVTNLEHVKGEAMMSQYARIEAPADSLSKKFMLDRWPVYFREKLRQDSAPDRVPNVSGHNSHDGHNH